MRDQKPLEDRSHRRLQYRLVSLVALMTATCLALSWYVWPKSVLVEAQVMASTLSVSPTDRTVPQPQFADFQAKLIAAFTSQDVLQDGVTVAGNGNLAMLRCRTDPVEWVRRRLEVTAAQNSIISVKIAVPEQYQDDAVELVDYIVFRSVTLTARSVDPIPRAELASAIERRQLLAEMLEAASQRIEQANHDFGSASGEVAAIKAKMELATTSWQRLNDDITTGELIDAFIDQLRFVQTATVTGKPSKTLFF